MEMNFAQRMGFADLPKPLKRDEFTQRLQNRIGNLCSEFLEKIKSVDRRNERSDNSKRFCMALSLFWDKDLGQSTKNISIYTITNVLETILNFKNENWTYFCCFLERLVQEYSDLASHFNKIFEEEMFAYRFIDGKLTPVTDDEEIKEIEDALASSNDGISHHLKQALSQLAKKPTPDYRNCIKESISAVEAACREITGENELRKALSRLSAKHNLNNEFKNGLQKFYDFTNDKSTGIRHALMDTDANIEIGYADAKYMLVVCSAFINYLRDKYNS